LKELRNKVFDGSNVGEIDIPKESQDLSGIWLCALERVSVGKVDNSLILKRDSSILEKITSDLFFFLRMTNCKSHSKGNDELFLEKRAFGWFRKIRKFFD
jgi:hypothetical protein